MLYNLFTDNVTIYMSIRLNPARGTSLVYFELPLNMLVSGTTVRFPAVLNESVHCETGIWVQLRACQMFSHNRP
jgi:hypothetical protein